MLFNTWEFVAFFCVVFGVYVCLPHKAQNVFLLLASWFFYGSWNWKLLGLLLGSTACGYIIGLKVEGATDRRRKRWLILGLCIDLGVLGLFKYFDFFSTSASEGLRALGFHVHPVVLQLVLPVGISFYTFQSIAYNVEVYLGRMKACRNPIHYALFIAYFPHLVAGPIQRPIHLLPQFERPRVVTWDKIATGATLVFIGLVRKTLLADMLAPEVDKAFAHPKAFGSLFLARAVLLFSLQIYGDFAGYTDMARGVSRMLGIELTRNFNHPYFATNISDFWRRWHISLSSWLRDYLYIPLGGNRGSRPRRYLNLLITMLLGGLWHGAAWNFVIWGAFHGVALVVHAIWKQAFPPPPPGQARWFSVFGRVGSWALTMLVVAIGWVFFRAHTFDGAIDVLRGIAVLHNDYDTVDLWLPGLMVALLLLLDVPQHRKDDHEAILRWPFPIRGLVYATLVLALVTFAPKEQLAFIYFDF